MKSRSPDAYLNPGYRRTTFPAARFRDIPPAPALVAMPAAPVSIPSPKAAPRPTVKTIPADPDR